MMTNIFVFQNPQVYLLKIKINVNFYLFKKRILLLLLLNNILPKRSRQIGLCKVIDIAIQAHNVDTIKKKIQN